MFTSGLFSVDTWAMRWERLRWGLSGLAVKRLALMGLTAALFVLAGRSFQPFRSTAALDREGFGISLPALAAGAGGPDSPLNRALGELRGQHFRILIHASPAGPRHTVISPDGVVLARGLTAAEVEAEFPALQLETMTAEAPDDLGSSFPDW